MVNRLLAIIFALVATGAAVGFVSDDMKAGLTEGLRIGIQIGHMKGQAELGTNVSAYNTNVAQFNEWLAQTFSGDPATIDQFSLTPIDQTSQATTGSQQSMHTIDGGPKATQEQVSEMGTGIAGGSEPMINGVPKSVYCTNCPECTACQ
ncbi:MAG: hypothetical protein JW986_00955 [Methanotrichaceae archaeon]|nr:hypothetical protein [Methanotrichaceae archaeon]